MSSTAFGVMSSSRKPGREPLARLSERQRAAIVLRYYGMAACPFCARVDPMLQRVREAWHGPLMLAARTGSDGA